MGILWLEPVYLKNLTKIRWVKTLLSFVNRPLLKDIRRVCSTPRKLLSLVFISCFFIFIWYLLSQLSESDSTVRHVYVLSATYFKNSTIYPPNSMVLLFNSQKGWPSRKYLTCKSFNEIDEKTEVADVRYQVWAVDQCSWSPYILVCPVVEKPGHFAITDQTRGSEPVNLSYRHAVHENLGVVACFSPLFFFERWQIMYLSLEIHRQFGVGRQVYYLQSIREKVYDFLLAYKRAGVVDIETWRGMNFGGTYEYSDNPNEELEWRNQAGAHTDCYVKYRESAEFIIISDIDDVLIPRHHKNYLDEFHELNIQYPWASALRYYRFNTAFQTEKDASGYSIEDAISTARLAMNQREDGKSVIKTKVVETVWIHWPALTKGWHKYYDIDSEFNFMVHFRNWTAASESKHINRKSKVYKKSRPLHNFYATDKFRLLQLRAENFVAKHAQFEFDALPSDSVYYKLIENCYNDMFYSRGRKVTTCPSPARCNFPGDLEGVECAVAGGRIKHTFINDNLIVHHSSISTKSMEIHSDGCQYL